MGSRGGAMVRALASHHCGSGSIPGLDVICGWRFLLVLFSAPRGFGQWQHSCHLHRVNVCSCCSWHNKGGKISSILNVWCSCLMTFLTLSISDFRGQGLFSGHFMDRWFQSAVQKILVTWCDARLSAYVKFPCSNFHFANFLQTAEL